MSFTVALRLGCLAIRHNDFREVGHPALDGPEVNDWSMICRPFACGLSVGMGEFRYQLDPCAALVPEGVRPPILSNLWGPPQIEVDSEI